MGYQRERERDWLKMKQNLQTVVFVKFCLITENQLKLDKRFCLFCTDYGIFLV